MSILIKGGTTIEELQSAMLMFKGHEIVELPDHGDLIDRNMLIGGFADWYIQESPMYIGDNGVVAETIGDAMKAIEAAHVVIPAERSEDAQKAD